MRICVLSGSPKGNYSVSYQTVLYLQKRFPEDSLEMFNVGGLISNPKLKAKMGGKLSEGMIAPYKKMLESIE